MDSQLERGISITTRSHKNPQFLESNRETRTLVTWNSVNFNWIQTFLLVKQGWRTGDLPPMVSRVRFPDTASYVG